MMENMLSVEICNVKGIKHLSIKLPLTPDVYAITGINGIGKSTLFSCISPRLKRPVSFSSLKETTEESSIIYSINDLQEKWFVKNGEWICNDSRELLMRGFQEGSLTNGTRFFNIFSRGFSYYKQMLNVDPDLIVQADPFVKENLGWILQNDKNHYENLFRLDRAIAEKRYKYQGVVYYLKKANKIISQFELSTGEFLLINILHLFNNLLVRTNNAEKLNVILIDEIELALHPSAIKRLVDFSKGIAKKYGVSIYFSTHSLEIINSLTIDNLFYLHKSSADEISCQTPCYPAYITRDIYTHSGYDVLILVEDDLAQILVNRYIENNRLDFNKRISVLPVGGYDNTLDLHENFLQEEILQPVSHIISIIDGDVKEQVKSKQETNGKWKHIPSDAILFLPIDSLEKYLKKELFDNKNYQLMRLLRDRLYRFETEIDWFEKEYINNIRNKQEDDRSKVKPVKAEKEYFSNGKMLFSILSAKYEEKGYSKQDFRDKICSIVIETINASEFEKELNASLNKLFL